MKNNQVSERSQCCNAKVRVIMSKDFFGDNPNTQIIGTCHYECLKCHQACDVIFRARKTWTINPATKIIPNKRKQSKKLNKKELEKLAEE
jgi:uncharacterized C2H2 Zn-finger protein